MVSSTSPRQQGRNEHNDPARQPQASAFWPLLEGAAEVVVQDAQKREIDDRVFKYVGVAGIDGPRIVQVGVSAENLPQD